MSNCLILLTNYYPFHKGEEYLESEIDHLANNFHKIVIISTMVSNNMTQTRPVPKNVTVLPVGIRHSILGKANMVIRKSKELLKQEETKHMINIDSGGRFLNKLYCLYFESRSMDIYDRVEKLLDKHDFTKYDSITIYSYWLYVTARVALELKNNYFKDRNPYTVSRAHRYDLYEDVAPMKYLPQRNRLLNGIDEIYPCSQDGVDFLKKTYPIYEKKIKVERLGTLPTVLTSHTKNDKLYIVSCSAVRKVKRLDLLIDVLADLELKNIPYKWTHIGDGPEYRKIKKLAQRKLNEDYFDFTGFLKNKDVLKFYEENPVTVFVNLSSSEGVPVSIMEAFSMGLPVIATDVGGTREIVENGVNGYLLRKDCTVQEVSKCLISYFNIDEEEYNQQRNKALETWNEKCNANVLYSDFAYKLANKR